MSLERELERARGLDTAELADAIERIGFECTRCGACCTKEVDDEGTVEPHTATVFPDEVRTLQEAAGNSGENGKYDEGEGGDEGDGNDDEGGDSEYGDENREWRDVARPMPYGLGGGDDGKEGETLEWALQTDACGDCVFYAEEDGRGACTVHADRPLICETYPFSVTLDGTAEPAGDPVDSDGMVRAHECEGLGRDIDREHAEDLAAALKERAIRELAEAISLRENYDPVDVDAGEVVVHDSEGAKHPDGSRVE